MYGVANRAKFDDVQSGGAHSRKWRSSKVDLEDVAVEHFSGLVLAPVVQHHSVLHVENVSP